MTSSQSPNNHVSIRPVQYRDLEVIGGLASNYSDNLATELETVKRWYGILHFLKLFPNPLQYFFWVYVALKAENHLGVIQVSPFNKSRSTWKVEWVAENKTSSEVATTNSIGTQLLRHCFETIWEARTWLLEVNIHEKSNLALYRQNGFQPLAQITYWTLNPAILTKLSQLDPEVPNLLPVSNADAQLLYQLDTVSMPPLLRQVFDRHFADFKTGLMDGLVLKAKQWRQQVEITKAYVFEPQRKAAIGYFRLETSKDGKRPHLAELTVHPAYTWLYPQLLVKMAQLVQGFPSQSLLLASADYQPEREEYLEKLGAEPTENTLLMSRSVWHKIKEAKPLEALQFAEMLKNLQPSRTPIPTRISLESAEPHPYTDSEEQSNNSGGKVSEE